MILLVPQKKLGHHFGIILINSITYRLLPLVRSIFCSLDRKSDLFFDVTWYKIIHSKMKFFCKSQIAMDLHPYQKHMQKLVKVRGFPES